MSEEWSVQSRYSISERLLHNTHGTRSSSAHLIPSSITMSTSLADEVLHAVPAVYRDNVLQEHALQSFIGFAPRHTGDIVDVATQQLKDVRHEAVRAAHKRVRETEAVVHEEEEEQAPKRVRLESGLAMRRYIRPQGAGAREPFHGLRTTQVPVVCAMVESVLYFGRACKMSEGGTGKTLMAFVGVIAVAHVRAQLQEQGIELSKRAKVRSVIHQVVQGMEEPSHAFVERRTLPPLLYIAPSGQETDLRAEAARVGIHHFDFLSYDELHGKARRVPDREGQRIAVKLSHPYLTRTDGWDGRTKQVPVKSKHKVVHPITGRKRSVNVEGLTQSKKLLDTRFEPTHALQLFVRRGGVLFADESHRANGDSLTNDALSALTRPMYPEVGLTPGLHGCYTVRMTLTPYMRDEQAVNLMRSLAIVSDANASHLEHLCRDLDKDRYESAQRELEREKAMRSKERRSEDQERHLWFSVLYRICILPRISMAISQPFKKEGVTTDYRAVVFLPPLEQRNDMERLQERKATVLARLVGLRKIQSHKRSEADKAEMGTLQSERTDIHNQIECIRIETLIRYATDFAYAHPTTGIFIPGPHLVPLHLLRKAFATEFGEDQVAYIDGETPGKLDNDVRSAIVRDFVQGRCRFLLAQLKVIAEGRNIHDTTGERPIHTFVLPSGDGIHITQVLRRTNRDGVKGHVGIDLFYLASAADYRKGIKDDRTYLTQKMLEQQEQVLGKVNTQLIKDGAPFASELPIYRETAPGHIELSGYPGHEDADVIARQQRVLHGLPAEPKPSRKLEDLNKPVAPVMLPVAAAAAATAPPKPLCTHCHKRPLAPGNTLYCLECRRIVFCKRCKQLLSTSECTKCKAQDDLQAERKLMDELECLAERSHAYPGSLFALTLPDCSAERKRNTLMNWHMLLKRNEHLHHSFMQVPDSHPALCEGRILGILKQRL